MNTLSNDNNCIGMDQSREIPTDSHEMIETFSKYVQKIRELFVLRLAQGNYKYLSNVHEQAEQLKIPMQNMHYVVFVVSAGESIRVGIRDAAVCLLEDKVRNSAFADNHLMACHIDMRGQLICVANVENQHMDLSKVETAIVRLLNEVNEESGVSLCYGMGTFVDKLEFLFESYETALSVLQHSQTIRDNTTFQISRDYFSNSVEIHEKLLELFRNGDIAGIQTLVKQHVDSIRLNVPGRQVLIERFAVLYLQHITNECMRLGVTLERFESYVPAVVCLMQSDSTGSIDAILQLTEQILKYISVHRTKEGNHLLNMAKEYIQENISNEKLDLATVGDHVGLSRVYFCKLFHQMEGISFSAYLKKVRIEKAKQLLLTTNMRIFEVGNAVGFSHAKYFGQVFKETVGLTPLEFKKGVNKEI